MAESRSDDDRFWLCVTRGAVDECWEWGACRQRGYGIFVAAGKNHRAYRWIYERERGPVADGLQLDHLCRNRACVNPAHMEQVTRKENILRGVCPSAENARKTHCIHGHPFAGRNVAVRRKSGRNGFERQCKTCRAASDARRHLRRRVLKVA